MELQQLREERERDETAFRSAFNNLSAELTRAKQSAEKQQVINHELLADQAKLQSELIEHLKLLRMREERLGLLRRDLADSEFEADQLKTALRCTADYSLQLEADRHAAEVVIEQAVGELDDLLGSLQHAAAQSGSAASAPAAGAAAAGASHTGAAEGVLDNGVGPSRSVAHTAPAALTGCWDVGQSDSSALLAPVGPLTDDGAGDDGVGAALHGIEDDGSRCRDAAAGEAASNGASSFSVAHGADGVQHELAGRGHEPQALSASAAVAATSMAMPAAPDLVVGGRDVCARLRVLRHKLHCLIEDPAVAAAAAAVAAATAKVAAATGSDAAADAGPEWWAAASEGGSTHNLSSSPMPAAAAAALVQLMAAVVAKERRTGGELPAEYDAAVGCLRDWGHRRHADTAGAAMAMAAASRAATSGGSGRGPGHAHALGARMPGQRPQPPSPTSPHASPLGTGRSTPLGGSQHTLSAGGLESLMPGWVAASQRASVVGAHGVQVVQGRRMAGASPPLSSQPSLSPTHSPNLSFAGSPVHGGASSGATGLERGESPSRTSPWLSSEPSMPGSPLHASTPSPGEVPGGGGAGHGEGGATASGGGGGAHGAAMPRASRSGATTERADSSLLGGTVPEVAAGAPTAESHGAAAGAAAAAAVAASSSSQAAAANAVVELEHELVSMRLEREALQRQVAELQRQNDLLQLRQLVTGEQHHHHAPTPAHPGSSTLWWGPGATAPTTRRSLGGTGSGGGSGASSTSAVAAVAATASTTTTPQVAPYFFGSLPPGRQPAPGLTGTNPSAKGKAGGAGLLLGGSSERALQPPYAPSCASPARTVPPAAVDRPPTLGLPTLSPPPQSLPATRARASDSGEAAAGGSDQAHGASSPTWPASTTQPSGVPAAAPGTAHTDSKAPSLAGLAAKVSAPPGVDAALWELDLLVATSKGM